MTSRPRASLGRVLDDLGTTLLEVVYGDADHAQDIGGVVIHDPNDELLLPPHALVLGVGLRDGEDIARVLAELAPHGAAGLVVRAPVPADTRLREAAETSGRRTASPPTSSTGSATVSYFGAAAAALYVHPNTFRYRLRRLAPVGELDLANPDARFAAMLQLRIVAPLAATSADGIPAAAGPVT